MVKFLVVKCIMCSLIHVKYFAWFYRLITVSPTDTVFMAAVKMKELGCTVVTVKNIPVGILT